MNTNYCSKEILICNKNSNNTCPLANKINLPYKYVHFSNVTIKLKHVTDQKHFDFQWYLQKYNNENKIHLNIF